MSHSVELVVILPTMTVAEIAQLCERYNAYVRIEGEGGKVFAYLQHFQEDDFIPSFLRKQAG
jgi:hypothetical protein